MRRFLIVLAIVCASHAHAATWKSEGPSFGYIHALVVEPAHPDTLYAGTHGGGVWKSTDGGRSWTLAGTKLASTVVHWIEIDPRKPGTVYAGAEGPGVARSKDGGNTWEWLKVGDASVPGRLSFAPKSSEVLLSDVNIHYRSTDGGATWKDFRVPGGDVKIFRYHPANPKVIWAGGVDGKGGLHKSTDGGQTWTAIGKGLKDFNHVTELIVDPSNPDVLYMKAFRGAYKSVDGGETWTAFTDDVGEKEEVEGLAIAPSSSKTIYASTHKGLYKSEDAGATWEDIDYGLPNQVVETILVHPTSSDVVWVGESGSGIYKTSDGGKTWVAANDGLAASWIDRLWADETGLIFAQTSTGLFRKDPGAGWTEVRKPFAREGEAKVDAIVFDRKNPRTIHVGDSMTYYRSTDGGKTWTSPAKPFQEPTPVFQSLVVDPGDAKILYSAQYSTSDPAETVFKSTDGGVKWKASAKGMTSTAIEMLAIQASGNLLALTKDAGVWRSTDGANSWSETKGLPAKGILGVAIDPAKPERAFAVMEKSIFRSEDGGATWSALTKGPKENMTAVAIAGGSVFVATINGVLRSADGGTTWTKFNDGLTNTDVRELTAAGSRLYAGTAGGGVFSIDVTSGT